MSPERRWQIRDSGTRVIACAVHSGDEVRTEILDRLLLSDDDRRREEDPATDRIADVGTSLVTVSISRFEVDFNRARASAVYRAPADAWGLDLWREPPTEAQVARSLELYDAFYSDLDTLIEGAIAAHGSFVVLDVHSYNHRRGGPEAAAADPLTDPEVNLGTRDIDRERWGRVIDALALGLANAGHDVRENVKFQGGHLMQHVNGAYGEYGCAIAIEFKKTFMDEWTGAVDALATERARASLAACVPALEISLAEGRP